ncbi:MAG: 30S ribosomal protein S13 [bacterium]|nr:30S ribosomal protein S13 [bacterium]
MDEKENKNFKYIVRIGNADLDGNKKIKFALRKIKGVSFSFASAICRTADVDHEKKAGLLDKSEIDRLSEVIKDAATIMPTWMLNRKKDPETGKNMHILTGDLQFAKDNDIRTMKKMKSYRGMRHATGLPVRGQRTRSNFRKNKGKVLGVSKKKIAAKK